jgi:hypothetical protein
MYKFYVSLDKDLNKDGTKDNMILKYKDSEFMGGIPLKNTTLISNSLFSKSNKPKIPKNAYYVISKKDLNNDNIKDFVLAIFKKNGELIVVIPLNRDELMKYKKGGNINNKNEINHKDIVYIKDETDFNQHFKAGAGNTLGSMLSLLAIDKVISLFDG